MDLNWLICAGVLDAILAQGIYVPKPNTNPDSQYGSRVYKVTGTQSLQSIQEYDLANVIEIRPLTEPPMCKIGSIIFVAMSRLKVATTTCASLPSTSSTDRINGENNFRRLWQYHWFLFFFIFSQIGKR